MLKLKDFLRESFLIDHKFNVETTLTLKSTAILYKSRNILNYNPLVLILYFHIYLIVGSAFKKTTNSIALIQKPAICVINKAGQSKNKVTPRLCTILVQESKIMNKSKCVSAVGIKLRNDGNMN